MDPTAVVRAVETLMAPLEWRTQDAWLAESPSRVRQVRGLPDGPVPVAPAAELEELLRVEGDEPGWLERALASPLRGSAAERALRPPAVASEDSLSVLAMRCAFLSGIATLYRQHAWMNTVRQ